MADKTLQIASSFSLSGGELGDVAIQKFTGLSLSVDTSGNIVGIKVGGTRELGSKPGPPKPGNPTFTAAILRGETLLADWWEKFNPNAKQGQYQPEDLTFTFEGENGPVAEWQLKGAFPMSYELSDADANSADLATETITLCVTEIRREK